jgi:SAM-dependent methyltransferase
MRPENRPICDYEGSDYQQRFWEAADRRYEDRVEAIALRRLLPPGQGRLLEVGAGAGRNTTRYPGFEQIVLLDYSRTQLALAINRLGESPRYLYVAADIYRMPFAPATFDAATMIRTLHHMVDPLAALRSVRYCLHNGAGFILEYANKRNLKAVLRWMAGRQEWNPFDQQPIEFTNLNFNFHPRAVHAWLGAADFAPQRQLAVSHFRLRALKRLLPLPLLVGLDSALQWTGSIWQFTPSLFVRALAVGEDAPATEGAFWRCPECRDTHLWEQSSGLECQNCGRLWPLVDGIYDFKQPR